MKGTIWFVGLMALIIGGGIGYSRMQQPEEESAARLVGALGFIEQQIEHSNPNIVDANPYISPKITASSSANTFRVAGRVKLLNRDADSGLEHSRIEPYQATVENLCKPYTDQACWRLHALEIEDAPAAGHASGPNNANTGEAAEPTAAASAERAPKETLEADGRSAASMPIETGNAQRSATDESARAPLADNALPDAPEPPALAQSSRLRQIEELIAKRADPEPTEAADETKAPRPSDQAAAPSSGDAEGAAAVAQRERPAEEQAAIQERPFASMSEAARQPERQRVVAETSPEPVETPPEPAETAPEPATVAAEAVSDKSRSVAHSSVDDTAQVARQPAATEPPEASAATEPPAASAAMEPEAAPLSVPDTASDPLVASAEDELNPVAPTPITDETRPVASAVAGQDSASAGTDGPTPPESAAPRQPAVAEPESAQPQVAAAAEPPAPQSTAEPPLTEAERVELEQGLARLGFYPGPVDGVLDGQSEGAIRDYQDFAALPSSGQPDRRLLSEVRQLAQTVVQLADDRDQVPAQSGADEQVAAAKATLLAMADAQAKLAEAAPPEPSAMAGAETKLAEAPPPEPGAMAGAEAKLAEAAPPEPTVAAQAKLAEAASPEPSAMAGAETKLAEAAPPEPTVSRQPLPSAPPRKPESENAPPDQPSLAASAPPAPTTEPTTEATIVAPLEAKPLTGSAEPEQPSATQVAFVMASLPEDIRQAIQNKRVDVRLDSGHTPLTAAITDGRQDAVAALLDHGANPNLSSEDGATALMYAAWAGDAESVRLLLQAGAEPNRVNLDRKTALMAAAATGQSEIAKLLLEAGADPNLQALKGWTALMYAVWRDQTEVVRLLLRHRADISIRNDDDETAVDIAAERARDDIRVLLVNASGAG